MGGTHEDDQVSLSFPGLRREGCRARSRWPGSAAAPGAAARDDRRCPRSGRWVPGASWLPRRCVMTSLRSILVWCTLLLDGLSPAVLPAQSPMSYSSVTEGRLLNPEPHNWLMYRGNYSGWGYGPLDQITPQNVTKLTPVWTFSTGVNEGHQSPPIVNNGVMFVSTPQAQVLALNAKTGDILWRYKRELPEDLLQLHPTNRGVGLRGNKGYVATVHAPPVAPDAPTREVGWDPVHDGREKGSYMH